MRGRRRLAGQSSLHTPWRMGLDAGHRLPDLPGVRRHGDGSRRHSRTVGPNKGCQSLVGAACPAPQHGPLHELSQNAPAASSLYQSGGQGSRSFRQTPARLGTASAGDRNAPPLVLLVAQAGWDRSIPHRELASELRRHRSGLRCISGCCRPRSALLGNVSDIDSGVSPSLVSICIQDARGIFDGPGTYAFARLLRAFHVLVLAGPVPTSRSSHASTPYLDRVETVRSEGSGSRFSTISPTPHREPDQYQRRLLMSGCDLGTLDLVCRAMDSPLRPLDYALLLHFRQPPDGARLRKGALSARNLYPVTGSSIEGRKWRRLEAPEHGLTIAEAEGGNTDGAIREFLRVPFRLDRETAGSPVVDPGQEQSRPSCHSHASRRGGSAQHADVGPSPVASRFGPGPVRGAYGAFRAPQVAPTRRAAHRRPLRRTGDDATRSGRARRRSRPNAIGRQLRIRASELPGTFTRAEKALHITTSCSSARWIRCTGGTASTAQPGRKTGVWLPMNIREDAFRGFGNGTSRIRVYRRFAGDDTLQSKCRHDPKPDRLVPPARRVGRSKKTHR